MITLRAEATRADNEVFRGRIYVSGEPHVVVSIELEPLVRDALTEQVGAKAIPQLCIRFAIPRWQAMAEAGDFLGAYDTSVRSISLGIADLVDLQSVAVGKPCRYQDSTGSDWTCLAGNSDLTRRTTYARCGRCEAPAADLVCSHATHFVPVEIRKSDQSIEVRMGGYCQLGHHDVTFATSSHGIDVHKEINSPVPKECVPYGQECWERALDVQRRRGLAFEARELAPAFDHLDAAWRLAFGRKRRLIGAGSLEQIVQLTDPVASRDALLSKLVALASVFDRMQVADDLRPTSTAERDWKERRALARIGLILEDRVETQGSDAVQVLREVLNLNNGLKHDPGTAARALAAVGLSYPIVDWAAAWNDLGAHLLTAVRQIIASLGKIAEED